MTPGAESLFTREIVLERDRATRSGSSTRGPVRNPVIFIVELGSVIVTGIFVVDRFAATRARSRSGSPARSRSGSG